MWHEHRRMEGAIKSDMVGGGGRRERAEPNQLCAIPGGAAVILQGTPLMPLRPWPRVLALTVPVYGYTGRQSTLKQPDSAFEIPLYFCFYILIVTVKCFWFCFCFFQCFLSSNRNV